MRHSNGGHFTCYRQRVFIFIDKPEIRVINTTGECLWSFCENHMR